MAQLITKESAARGGSRVALREIKCQGGERIKRGYFACISPVKGLHTDNADHQPRGHAKLRFRQFECGAVAGPEALTCLDSDGLYKTLSVAKPIFLKGFGCWAD